MRKDERGHSRDRHAAERQKRREDELPHTVGTVERTSTALSPRSRRRARHSGRCVISGCEKMSAGTLAGVISGREKTSAAHSRSPCSRGREDELRPRRHGREVERTSAALSPRSRRRARALWAASSADATRWARGTHWPPSGIGARHFRRRRPGERGHFTSGVSKRAQKRREDERGSVGHGREDERGYSRDDRQWRREDGRARGTLAAVEKMGARGDFLPVS